MQYWPLCRDVTLCCSGVYYALLWLPFLKKNEKIFIASKLVSEVWAGLVQFTEISTEHERWSLTKFDCFPKPTIGRNWMFEKLSVCFSFIFWLLLCSSRIPLLKNMFLDLLLDCTVCLWNVAPQAIYFCLGTASSALLECNFATHKQKG